ncbi:MAG: hypothetical protein FJ202_12295 [Gemmatimonadetes bacterium]|nr:hypothetical protein [Gemmatimonadota bacterium]
MSIKRMFATVAGLALVAQGAVAQSKPTVAVLPWTNSALGAANADLAALGKGIADLLINAMAANSNIRVVERDRIQAVLDEQKLASDGRIDPQTTVRLGKIVGAHHMVTGVYITELSKNTIRLSGRVFNTETTEVERGDFSVEGRTDALLPLVDQLAAKMNSGLNLPSIPARDQEQHASATKKQEKVPFQAVMLYSRALDEQDRGNKEKAVTLYRQAIAAFPAYEAPQSALKKLEGK